MFADLKREWAGWVEMFGPEVIKRTHVGMGIMFFQQFVGINALIYYRCVFRLCKIWTDGEHANVAHIVLVRPYLRRWD
jgi:hypothetical protein